MIQDNIIRTLRKLVTWGAPKPPLYIETTPQAHTHHGGTRGGQVRCFLIFSFCRAGVWGGTPQISYFRVVYKVPLGKHQSSEAGGKVLHCTRRRRLCFTGRPITEPFIRNPEIEMFAQKKSHVTNRGVNSQIRS